MNNVVFRRNLSLLTSAATGRLEFPNALSAMGPGADDVPLVFERIGWLPLATPSGWKLIFALQAFASEAGSSLDKK